MYFVLFCIILPLIVAIYCKLDKSKGEEAYQSVKSVWYFYSALFLIYKYFGANSITEDHLTGFAIALALFEGVPGYFKFTIKKLKIFFGI